MTSLSTSNEKLQKLINKEDTLISIESDMTAYRKSFKTFCFLCHDTHLVTQCSQLSKAQIYIEKKLSKSRSKSRGRKNRRYRYSYSSFDSNSIFSELSSESENNKKKKKKKNIIFKFSLKKPDKEKKKIKDHVYTAISDISDSFDSQFTYAVYGALFESDSNSRPDEEKKKVMTFIAAAKEDISAVRELLSQTRARAKALRDFEVSRQQRGAQLSTL